MDRACCATPQSCAGRSLPGTCSLACAVKFVPMYHDCMHTINGVYDVAASDTTADGKATAFAAFEGKCASISTSLLKSKIDKLRASHCVVDTAAIHGARAVSKLPPGCKDNDAGMVALISQSCKQIKAKQMCKAVAVMGAQKLCGCSCPDSAGSAHKRNLFAFAEKACPTSTFHARLVNARPLHWPPAPIRAPHA